jgi:exonuclease SbcD
MGLIRFLHASDLHFGSYQYHNSYRVGDFLRAFQQILDLAQKRQVHFVLLGGDVFDSQEILPGILTDIVLRLRRFQTETNHAIPIFTIEGNHDMRKHSRGHHIESGQSWIRVLHTMELITLLGDEDQKFRIAREIHVSNTRILGFRYFGQDTGSMLHGILNNIRHDPSFFTIMLAHFGIQGQMQGVPGMNITEVNPLHDRIQYLGLGHFHRGFTIGNWIFNPGSIEVNSVMETNFTRGVFFVEISDSKSEVNRIHASLIPLRNRTYIYHEITVNSNIRSQSIMEQALKEQLTNKIPLYRDNVNFSNPSIPVLLLTIRGRLTFSTQTINLDQLKAFLFKHFALVDIQIFDKRNSSEILSRNLDTFLVKRKIEIL